LNLADDLENIVNKYNFKSDKNQKIFNNLSEYLTSGITKLRRMK
jgi:hypothetical protein